MPCNEDHSCGPQGVEGKECKKKRKEKGGRALRCNGRDLGGCTGHERPRPRPGQLRGAKASEAKKMGQLTGYRSQSLPGKLKGAGHSAITPRKAARAPRKRRGEVQRRQTVSGKKRAAPIPGQRRQPITAATSRAGCRSGPAATGPWTGQVAEASTQGNAAEQQQRWNSAAARATAERAPLQRNTFGGCKAAVTAAAHGGSEAARHQPRRRQAPTEAASGLWRRAVAAYV